MKKVKLGEVCEIKSGGTPSRANMEYWNDGNIPWVKISDIKEKYLRKTEEFITQQGLENSSAKIFKKRTIIYTIFATLGEVAILDIEASTNQAIAGLQIIDKNVYQDYLYYFLISLKGKVNDIGRGVAQNNINLSILKNFEIPLPNLGEQKEIADRLDKVSSLIEKRKTQLKKLDELIKSHFIEMFTPFLSQQKTLLDSLCETITKGTTPTTLGFDFIDNGINFIKIENISANEKIDTTNMLHISEECNIKLKRSILKENDILFSIAGTKMGITAKVTRDVLPANTNQALAIIRLKKEDRMNVDFLIELLHSDMIIEQIESMKSTVAQTNLSLDNIKNFKVIVPPISLQNEFAEFVKLIDKSKLGIQKSIDKLETLKKSLMQQYFG